MNKRCLVCGEKLDNDGWCDNCLEFRGDELEDDTDDYIYEQEMNDFKHNQDQDELIIDDNLIVDDIENSELILPYHKQKWLKNFNALLLENHDHDGLNTFYRFIDKPTVIELADLNSFYILKYAMNNDSFVTVKDWEYFSAICAMNGYHNSLVRLLIYYGEGLIKSDYSWNELNIDNFDHPIFNNINNKTADSFLGEYDLPLIDKVKNIDKLIYWLDIGVGINNYYALYYKMLMFFYGFGPIQKDYSNAIELLKKLTFSNEKTSDENSDDEYFGNYNRYSERYYYRFLISIYFSENKVVDAFSVLLKYYGRKGLSFFDKNVEPYQILYNIMGFRCVSSDYVAYRDEFSNNHYDRDFNDKACNEYYPFFNKLKTMIENKNDEEIDLISSYRNFLEEVDRIISDDYYNYDDYRVKEMINDLKKEFQNVLEKIDEINESDYLSYKNFKYLIEDNNIRLMKYNGNENNVIIPDYIQGFRVSSLGNRLFSSNEYIDTIVIPKTIEFIDEGCFRKSSIKTIKFLNSMKILPKSLFRSCDQLQSVILPNDLEIVGEYCFYQCSSLVKITLPDEVHTLSDNAFAECSNLKEVIITNKSKMTKILSNCFDMCVNLKSIKIPSSVFLIGSWSFRGCERLTKIDFAHRRTSAKVDESYSMQFLSEHNLAKNTSFDFLYIYDHAFFDCSKLKVFNIPNNTIYIGDSAFENCVTLKYLNISEQVTYIGRHAFNNCIQLIIDIDREYEGRFFDSTLNGVNIRYLKSK